MMPFAESPDELLATCEATLARARLRPFELLVVTAASNVTGELWPIRELAELAHAHGAQIVVDAAQLAPHRPISMRELGIDFLALSGHKLYAPYGAGALIARRDAITEGVPLLKGGGAVQRVTLDDVVWSDVPDRYEAGSPNVIGAVALGVACDVLADLRDAGPCGRGAPARRPAARGSARHRRASTLLDAWADERIDRVGVSTFTVEGREHRLVAAALAAEHAISVRSGAFCAHPLVGHLLGLSPELTDGRRAGRSAVRRGAREHRDRGRRASRSTRSSTRCGRSPSTGPRVGVRARSGDAPACARTRHAALARARAAPLGRAPRQRRALPLIGKAAGSLVLRERTP